MSLNAAGLWKEGVAQIGWEPEGITPGESQWIQVIHDGNFADWPVVCNEAADIIETLGGSYQQIRDVGAEIGRLTAYLKILPHKPKLDIFGRPVA